MEGKNSSKFEYVEPSHNFPPEFYFFFYRTVEPILIITAFHITIEMTKLWYI